MTVTPRRQTAIGVTSLLVPSTKQNRLNGRCPDLRSCSLQIACSALCWRLEGDLIEAARVAGAKTAGVPVRLSRPIRASGD